MRTGSDPSRPQRIFGPLPACPCSVCVLAQSAAFRSVLVLVHNNNNNNHHQHSNTNNNTTNNYSNNSGQSAKRWPVRGHTLADSPR